MHRIASWRRPPIRATRRPGHTTTQRARSRPPPHPLSLRAELSPQSRPEWLIWAACSSLEGTCNGYDHQMGEPSDNDRDSNAVEAPVDDAWSAGCPAHNDRTTHGLLVEPARADHDRTT